MMITQSDSAQCVSTVHPPGIPSWADWRNIKEYLPSIFYKQSGPNTAEYAVRWVQASLRDPSVLENLSTVVFILLVAGLALRDIGRLATWMEVEEDDIEQWPSYVRSATALGAASLQSDLDDVCKTLHAHMRAAYG